MTPFIRLGKVREKEVGVTRFDLATSIGHKRQVCAHY
jgi:hypothetical protein